MSATSIRRVGAYAKLLANYASDDAVIAAGEQAELLFVRGLAFCATSDSDGYVTDAQLTRFVGAGMRDTIKRAKRLVEVGLWSREDGGYQVRSWTKIHETSEEKGRALKADRERKRVPPPDGFQTESGRNPDQPPDGVQTEGSPDSLSLNSALQNSAVHGTESDTDSQPPTKPRRAPMTPPPDIFPITDAMRTWAGTAGIRSDLDTQTERFLDHNRAKDVKYADWIGAWRNWMRKADEFAAARPGAATAAAAGNGRPLGWEFQPPTDPGPPEWAFDAHGNYRGDPS